MNREERLRFCRICTRQRLDSEKGIVCSLTNAPASFEVSCTMFSEDTELKHKAEMQSILNSIHLNEASKGKRFLNNLLDGLFAYLFTIILMVFVGMFIGLIKPDLVNSISTNETFGYLIIIISTFIYYLFFESLTGRTPGKMITKTIVIDQNGHKPNFTTILLRTLCRFIPFNAFSFLIAENGWHDAFSKTKVVDVI
ncbi:MAG: RDD family protein [Carboxylicivirga sp.]|jgi:uncharacterized RDD family membrane protein YckC|nr:RDD family protein [Carboxylicivirga sp.]